MLKLATGSRQGSAGLVDRLYARLRRCYLDAFSAWFLGLTAVMCALADWVFALYVPMSTGRFVVLLALDELIILLAMGTGTLRFTRAAEPIRSWLRRDPGPAGAIGAWSAATRLPRRALEIAVPHAVVLGGIPATILIEAEFGFSPVTALLFFVGLLAAAIYPAIIFYFTLELMLRPVLRDIAPWLPAGFEPPASGVSLRRKLLVALPLVNIISGGFVGVLASLASGGSLSDLGLYVVFSVVIASTASLVLTLLVVRALLVPVDDLLSATRRISEGDLTTRALVGSDDEMGTLAGSFNTMTSELVESRQRLVQAREEERRRLRRDLHDGVGPTLAAVILQLDGARRLLATDTEAADALLGQLRSQTQGVVDEIRRLVYALRPPALDDLGFAGAIRERAQAFAVPAGHPGGLAVEVDVPEHLPQLPAAVEVAAFRIIQEALTNAARHSGGSQCQVRVEVNGRVEVEVSDNGRGIPARRRAGVGLGSMRERAAEVGGRCEVASAPGSGTQVRAWLPSG